MTNTPPKTNPPVPEGEVAAELFDAINAYVKVADDVQNAYVNACEGFDDEDLGGRFEEAEHNLRSLAAQLLQVTDTAKDEGIIDSASAPSGCSADLREPVAGELVEELRRVAEVVKIADKRPEAIDLVGASEDIHAVATALATSTPRSVQPEPSGESELQPDHWQSATKEDREFASSDGLTSGELSLSVEVPMLGNAILKRTPQNMYWPTQVAIEIESGSLISHDARKLASILNELADLADAEDFAANNTPTPESVSGGGGDEYESRGVGVFNVTGSPDKHKHLFNAENEKNAEAAAFALNRAAQLTEAAESLNAVAATSTPEDSDQ